MLGVLILSVKHAQLRCADDVPNVKKAATDGRFPMI